MSRHFLIAVVNTPRMGAGKLIQIVGVWAKLRRKTTPIPIRDMKLFNFRIHPELEAALKARAAQEGTTPSAISRAALVQYLKLKTPVTVR